MSHRYAWWEQNHWFEANEEEGAENLAMYTPPPNVTGTLSLSDSYMATVQVGSHTSGAETLTSHPSNTTDTA